MNMMIRSMLICFISAGVALQPGLCADPASSARDTPRAPAGRDAAWKTQGPEMMDAPPVIRKLGDGVFRVGEVTVDKIRGVVRVPGQVNMDDGLVEYLACGPGGKLHESILMLLVQPYDLQIALLLLGLEPGDNPLSAQGAQGVPDGEPVEIWVAWQSEGKEKIRLRAEALVFNQKTGKAMQSTHWIFTGSQIIDGQFMAQKEQSVAATYHDPFAMFDHPLAAGTDDTLYHVNRKTVPPKGTLVSFEIKSR